MQRKIPYKTIDEIDNINDEWSGNSREQLNEKHLSVQK